MRRIHAVGQWLAGEWGVPRWICLLIVCGWIANLAARIAT
jgi:hypothetical protein